MNISKTGKTSRPLSLLEKLRQESVQDFLSRTLANKTAVGPIVVELDPTTACNLACHDCISANLLNQGGFERERLKDLANEFVKAGVKAVVLIGGGEPMAHPEFGWILKYFHDAGLHTGVTTNGTLLKKFQEECVTTKWLRVSVDAGTPEIFSEFRPHRSGKSQFDLVINNMREFAGKKTGLLGYSFLLLNKHDKTGGVTKSNAVDIYKAAKLAQEIGCDYFELKPAFDMMHFLQKQDSEVVQIVNSELEKAHGLKSEKFDVIAPFTLEEALGGATTQVKNYNRCLTSELRTVVSPSGTYVCPYHRGNPSMKIGDATKDNFVELWSSKKRKEVMEKVNPQIHCSFHCIRHESNLLLERMMAGEAVQSIPDFDRFI